MADRNVNVKIVERSAPVWMHDFCVAVISNLFLVSNQFVCVNYWEIPINFLHQVRENKSESSLDLFHINKTKCPSDAADGSITFHIIIHKRRMMLLLLHLKILQKFEIKIMLTQSKKFNFIYIWFWHNPGINSLILFLFLIKWNNSSCWQPPVLGSKPAVWVGGWHL